jgi:hypothetical protein
MVPEENGSEAALVDGIEVIALDRLRSITASSLGSARHSGRSAGHCGAK